MFYRNLLIVGLLLLTLALRILFKSISHIERGTLTIGTVVDFEQTIGDKGMVYYRPIFRYKNLYGREFRYKYVIKYGTRSRKTLTHAHWTIGQQANIIYDPWDPAIAKVVTYFGLFGWSIILASFAMPFITVGGAYYIARMYIKGL